MQQRPNLTEPGGSDRGSQACRLHEPAPGSAGSAGCPARPTPSLSGTAGKDASHRAGGRYATQSPSVETSFPSCSHNPFPSLREVQLLTYYLPLSQPAHIRENADFGGRMSRSQGVERRRNMDRQLTLYSLLIGHSLHKGKLSCSIQGGIPSNQKPPLRGGF